MTTDGDISPLFGRVLVLVAHPDDETACSVLLHRAGEAHVAFATDGAPAPEFFWSSYSSRRQYATVRHAEALHSLAVIGVAEPLFLRDDVSDAPFQDQALHLSLRSAKKSLEDLAHRLKPDALVAPAYEGGHPDHDACSFLAAAVGRSLSLPTFEMPLYHRSPSGTLVHQAFRDNLGADILLYPTQLELQDRAEMLNRYVSQTDLAMFVTALVERLRPQPVYDYLRPPHLGLLNYEVWGWHMTGTELCSAFQNFGMNRVAWWRRSMPQGEEMQAQGA